MFSASPASWRLSDSSRVTRTGTGRGTDMGKRRAMVQTNIRRHRCWGGGGGVRSNPLHQRNSGVFSFELWIVRFIALFGCASKLRQHCRPQSVHWYPSFRVQNEDLLRVSGFGNYLNVRVQNVCISSSIPLSFFAPRPGAAALLRTAAKCILQVKSSRSNGTRLLELVCRS
jgi:hypothetical protein